MIITISREYATNGVLIARKVAEQLRIPIYERELLEKLACALDACPTDVDQLYEQASGPLQAIITEWLTSISPERYLRYLRKTLNAIHAKGDAVVVGRGANFVLRKPDCLHIRIIAPLELRAAIFQAGNDLPLAEVQRIITQRDQERARYAKHLFHEKIDDVHHYDLVINLRSVTPEQAVEQIVLAARGRLAHTLPAGSQATMPEHLRMMIAAKHHVRPELVERSYPVAR